MDYYSEAWLGSAIIHLAGAQPQRKYTRIGRDHSTVSATEDSTGNNERNLFLGHLKDVWAVPKMRSYFYEHDTKGKRHLCLVFHTYASPAY
jgi:flagellar motor switch protein FliM